MDLFSEIKSRVSMENAARYYGFEVARGGKIRCPFHDDRHPSLQIYKDGRGWWCYVCDMGGSVIDFVAKLYSLSPKEAAQKLNEDFGLGLAVGSAKPTRSLERRARSHTRIAMNLERDAFRREYEGHQQEFIRLHRKLTSLPPESRSGAELDRLAQLEYWFERHPFK